MLTMLLMTSVLVSLIACEEEKPKGPPYLGEIKMYDSSGNEVAHSEWVTVKYTGEEVVFTADYIFNERTEKKYDEMNITIYKRNPESFLYERMDDGWQKNDLDWPIKVGEYSIRMTYVQKINGLANIHVEFKLIIEE